MIVKLRHYPECHHRLRLLPLSRGDLDRRLRRFAVGGSTRRCWQPRRSRRCRFYCWRGTFPRFSSAQNFFAFLAILYMETVRPAPHTSWRAPVLCSPCRAGPDPVPFVYAFFEISVSGIAARSTCAPGRSAGSPWPGHSSSTGISVLNSSPRSGTKRHHRNAWYVERLARHVDQAARDEHFRRRRHDDGRRPIYCRRRARRKHHHRAQKRLARRDEAHGLFGNIGGKVIDGTFPGGRWIAHPMMGRSAPDAAHEPT